MVESEYILSQSNDEYPVALLLSKSIDEFNKQDRRTGSLVNSHIKTREDDIKTFVGLKVGDNLKDLPLDYVVELYRLSLSEQR